MRPLDVDAYLERIDYAGSREPTAEVLRALHVAHLSAVPFENLSIHTPGEQVVLDEDALFDKVVRRRRGGFCYELNGAFAALLTAMGFRVDRLAARVFGEGGRLGIPFDHLALLVHVQGGPRSGTTELEHVRTARRGVRGAQPPANAGVRRALPNNDAGGDPRSGAAPAERWLCDVGFGDGPTIPLRFDERGEQPEVGRVHRIEPAGENWNLRQRRGDADELRYQFSVVPHALADFEPGMRHHTTSPDSPFTQRRLCSLLRATGRVTVVAERLIFTSAYGTRVEFALPDAAAFDEHLWFQFGITL